MTRESISLFELNNQIRQVISNNLPAQVWVRAEVAELREHANGHCYLDLVEKDEFSNQVIARLRATIWSYTYRTLKPFFENTAKRPLSNGIKVLVRGSVEYQELYGLSFNIKEIDPAYTLGDLEQRRLEVIRKLQEEGVFNMNKELDLPLVPQRIAVISSPTAAGYGDFADQLAKNLYGIKFYHKLFPAIMQGDKAPESIIAALEKVNNYSEYFDVVVLIRGGGASLDLLCFDDYWLAYHVAQFPMPIISGIGHERDVSVTDMVAHTSAKTPTAVAEFLIAGASSVLEKVNSFGRNLKNLTREQIQGNRTLIERSMFQLHQQTAKLLAGNNRYLEGVAGRLPGMVKLHLEKRGNVLQRQSMRTRQVFKRIIENEDRRLERGCEKLKLSTARFLSHAGMKLEMLEKSNKLNDPVEVLKRGFSITRVEGRALKSTTGLKPGEVVETILKDGSFLSEVKDIDNAENKVD